MQSINSGDTAFILICTALVCMMTPALALFYGGLVKQRDVLSIMIQNFICMGVVGLIWVFGGFSLAFGPTTMGGFIGDIRPYFGMYHVGVEPNPNMGPTIPFIMVFAYQMMFAIITPALMTGAFVGRLNFGPYLLHRAVDGSDLPARRALGLGWRLPCADGRRRLCGRDRDPYRCRVLGAGDCALLGQTPDGEG